MNAETNPFQVLIVDLGSQYTLVIGRVLRELGFRSLILNPQKAEKWLEHNQPKCAILSGGYGSVENPDCPKPPTGLFELKIPILGICLGMQWIAKMHGGKVTPEILLHKEYGPCFIQTRNSYIFEGIKDYRTMVWASHGDSVQQLPEGFTGIAFEEDYRTQSAISNADGSIIGLQFHPEVDDTTDGKLMLRNFLDHAGCEQDWDPFDIIEHIRNEVREAVVTDDTIQKAILGFSGGVDSTVTAALLQPVMGDDLLCVTIDSGFLRLGELDNIKKTAASLGLNHIVIDAVEELQISLGDTIDPEEKRKIFKKIYLRNLEEQIATFGAKFIIQGSLATDFIESGKAGGSDLIKSHHNIGLEWQVQEIHPLRTLFKYEVREIGRSLSLSRNITERQPFPGPGLLVRIVGYPATQERADILRQCDEWVTEILEDEDLYDDISQLVVALGMRTVGVKGDKRTYGYCIIVRPVITQDFMTCTVMKLPEKVIDAIVSKLTKHPDVTRVLFDLTPKPPGTTEME